MVEEGVDHVASELFLCQICKQLVLQGEVSMIIEAPIVPGESAAGIQLGSPIEEVLNAHNNSFSSGEVVRPSFPTLVKTRYRSAIVDVWAIEGRVKQIMVHDGYRGKLMGKIGLGSTIADIERHIGAVEEDEEDTLVIRDFPGLFFEIEGYFPDLQQDPTFRYAPMKEIYVHTTPIEWQAFDPGQPFGLKYV